MQRAGYGVVMMTTILAACSTANPSAGGTPPVAGSAGAGAASGDAGGSGGVASRGAVAVELALTGKVATFTLRNTGSAPVTVLTRVGAGELHYDWFTVEIQGGGDVRRLGFIDDRNRSAAERVSLDPAATWSGDVDLAAWAARPINGGRPLPSGPVTVRAIYEVTAASAVGGGVWLGRAESAPVKATW